MTLPEVSFRHLRQLTDLGGLYEHALGTDPRPEHGYCLDDAARGLVVVSRAPDQRDLLAQYLAFVLAAQSPDGRFRNRRAADHTWTDEPSVEDCWGRALWGLGSAYSGRTGPKIRAAALAGFDRSALLRSPWPRAMCFAGLGAAEVLRVNPAHPLARKLLAAAAKGVATSLPEASYDVDWPWPEPRLTYANAALPEVLLAAGAALARPNWVATGLRLLEWLLAVQTRGGHLSVVPVGGRGPGQDLPRFDQQPIEVAALADACARAFAVTGDLRWRDGVDLAAAWFVGANDSGTPMYDEVSGGGFDGLEPAGRNANQGAESTLALISTLQRAAQPVPAAR